MKPLTDRIVGRAKRLLMRRHRWDEERAYKSLRSRAMMLRLTIPEVAQQILDGRLR
jgi:AmiR/NasT family two-component response regulator